jgi:hypothetical protein
MAFSFLIKARERSQQAGGGHVKNENKGKENRKDPGDKQRMNKNKNRGQAQSGHTEHRE